jgi:hypothetical protein
MTQGQQFSIHNNSSGSLTVNSSGANLVGTITANTTATITCILTSGTDALSWDFDLTGFTTALPVARGGTGLTTLGTAGQVLAVNAGATALEYQTAGGGGLKTEIFTGPGTWTNPGSVTSVRVTVVGGGGGGQPRNPPGARGGYGGYGKVVATIPTSPVSVTVGGGGGGGGAGGTSSFGPFASATGGGGGSYPNSAVGANGTASTSGTFLVGSTNVNTLGGNNDGIIWGPTNAGPGNYSVSAGKFAGGAQLPFSPGSPGGLGGVVVVEFVG